MKYNEMPESSTKIDINYNKGTLYVKSKANPGHLNWIFTLFLVISVTILLSVYRPPYSPQLNEPIEKAMDRIKQVS